MLVDCHLHPENRNTEEGAPHFQDLEEFIVQGKKRGVEIFGFSDHCYIYNDAKSINFNAWQRERMRLDLKEYAQAVNAVRNKYPNVLLGLEVDYVPHKENEIKTFLDDARKEHNFDFFIGSVHWIDGWGFDIDAQEYKQKMDASGIDNIYQKYFEIIEKEIRSNLFDVIGHIDLIKIFGAKFRDVEHMKRIASVLKEHDHVIEINTNGKNKPIGEFYPNEEFLKECFTKGIDLTLGSDAHSPDRTGEGFQEVVDMVKKIGYSRIAYFRGGDRRYVEI